MRNVPSRSTVAVNAGPCLSGSFVADLTVDEREIPSNLFLESVRWPQLTDNGSAGSAEFDVDGFAGGEFRRDRARRCHLRAPSSTVSMMRRPIDLLPGITRSKTNRPSGPVVDSC